MVYGSEKDSTKQRYMGEKNGRMILCSILTGGFLSSKILFFLFIESTSVYNN